MKISKQEARDLGILPDEQKGPRKASRQWNEGLVGTSAPMASLTMVEALCQAHGLPRPVAEYQFHPTRKWRLDFLWGGWLALEIQGGIWTGGRHTRGAALLAEHEKLNAAVCLGYAVLFCTPADLESGAIFPVIKEALASHGEQP